MNPSSNLRQLAAGSALIAVAGSSALAAPVIKADNTTSLNLAGSYVSGGPPGSGDTIEITNIFTSSRTASLGNDLSIAGINQTADADFQFQIGATAGRTLTIGSAGVTMASTIAGANLIFANAVTLGTSQTWTTTSGRNLQMNGAFSDGGNTLAVVGSGLFDLRGSNTFGSNVTIDSSVSVNSPSATVVLGGANTMNSLAVPSGRVVGATLGNFGQASNFGDGGTNTAITLGGNGSNGVMEYSGTSTASNRTVNRDGRSATSGIEVTQAGQTLTLSANLGSGTQLNSGTNGWVFGGAGNLTLNGAISNSSAAGSTGTTVTKNGTGTLILGGNSNSYTGNTQVNSGTLLVNGNVSTSLLTTVKTGATLGGTGTVGNLLVEANGNLAPGDNGIESLNITGNLTLDSGSFSLFEINTAGNLADLAATTSLMTFGGTLQVTNVGSTLLAGDLFNLFDWSSATGTFSSVLLPSLDPGLEWDQSNLYSTGEISVIAIVPEPQAALLGGLGLLALLRRRRQLP